MRFTGLRKKRSVLLLFTAAACVVVFVSRSLSGNLNQKDFLAYFEQHGKEQTYIDTGTFDFVAKVDTTARVQTNLKQGQYNKDGISQQDDQITARFLRRQHVLRQACEEHQANESYPQCEILDVSYNLKYVKQSDLVYCAIEKTGSTFWKRILHVIGGWGNNMNPTLIKSKDADSKTGGFQTLYNETLDVMEDIMKSSSKIMFVRDPYTRLLSAWLDKLYSPNHYYWSTLGPLVFRLSRPFEVTNQTLKCAHDIHFREFLNYIMFEIESRKCVDGHYSPNFKHCLPCHFEYDFIGKYETFKEDTLYILRHLTLSKQVIFDDFETDAITDAIRYTTDWVFSQKKELKNCSLTFHCALFKTWKRLQSRGILDKHLEFPYQTLKSVEKISREEFKQVLIEANKLSDPKELKINRQESLQQAYQGLPPGMIKRLLRTFQKDFDMFEYKRRPQYLAAPKTNTVDYFEECPL